MYSFLSGVFDGHTLGLRFNSLMITLKAGLAMLLFAGVREEKLWNEEGVPAAFKGVPMVLVSATILSLSFMGFSGLFQ